MELFETCFKIMVHPTNISYTITDDLLTINANKHDKIVLKIISTELNYKLEQNDNNFKTIHLLNLLKFNNFITITQENVFDFFEYIDNNIKNITGICALCYDKIIDTNKVNTCKKCFDKSLKLVLDNCVTDCYKSDKIVFNILVLSAYSCLKHPKKSVVFKPYSNEFPDIGLIESKLNYKFDNFSELLNIINRSKDDNELLEQIKQLDYMFLKFLIKTNITNLKSDILFSNENNIFKQIEFSNIIESKNIITLSVSHDLKTEKDFKSTKSNYLFHGSSLSNWYSLLRNGIQNKSGTELMAHGQAYGSGIYLSNIANLASNYGRDAHTRSKIFVIGVVEVLNDINTYKKTPNIYVVKNDNEILLRYVIIASTHTHLENITDYFTKQRCTEIKSCNSTVNAIQKKRLLNEFNKMQKIAQKNNWIFSEKSDTFWSIEINNSVINITFGSEYPLVPPFIWFDKLDKQVDNNYVFEKGAIFINDIVPKEWNSNKKICVYLPKFINNNILNSSKIDIILNNENDAFEEYNSKLKELMLI